jgi:hypothetical protein
MVLNGAWQKVEIQQALASFSHNLKPTLVDLQKTADSK